MDHHGIPSQGLSVGLARQAVIYHFLSAYSIVLSASLPETHLTVIAGALGVSGMDVMQVLSDKRADLVHGHGTANPLHAIFDQVKLLPKAALVSLGTLHGVDVGTNPLPTARNLIATHIASGKCGLHKSGYCHLGCASLLSLSSNCNKNLHVSNMDLEDSITVNFDLAQINILASVMAKLNKRPLRRILQMHKVDFNSSDGTAALHKLLKGYLHRLWHGTKLADRSEARVTDKALLADECERELTALRKDWPQLIPSNHKRSLVRLLIWLFQRIPCPPLSVRVVLVLLS
ncbi:hypothetical protein B0H10DRAFT_1939964 [Mycena sp. CBHHK59/15]|nr:hypothetical protein B0H10DRAFT_1939964 [Mycena sp. CBHHK59/15]